MAGGGGGVYFYCERADEILARHMISRMWRMGVGVGRGCRSCEEEARLTRVRVVEGRTYIK